MLFRVDQRCYKKGDVIVPETKFETMLKDEKKKMEEMLNQKRLPEIPERGKCLFLFLDLRGALQFYYKYGGNLYAVIPYNIYYRGDMNKLDNILDLIKIIGEDKDGIIEAAVNYYWKDGTHTFCPCYEYLAEKAEVLYTLCNNDKLSQFREDVHNCCSIERTPLYKELIEIVWRR